MKKINLFWIFLLPLATGCQKESIQHPQSAIEEHAIQDSIHISYWIDGALNTVALQNISEFTSLVGSLTQLAMQGHHIHISNDDVVPSVESSKDVVRFSTQDQKKFEEWIVEMEKQGYDIDYYYDKETNTFHGIATKK